MPTGKGDDVEIVTDPVKVSRECCGFGTRRMGLMQPKWFKRYDVAEGHKVWAIVGGVAAMGVIKKIDDDGRYTVTLGAAGATAESLCREHMCRDWQVAEATAAGGMWLGQHTTTKLWHRRVRTERLSRLAKT